MLKLIAFLTLAIGVQCQSAVESILSEGYPAESYNVTTQDGYILEVLRIPHGKSSPNSSATRKVVFLMHGLLSSFKSFTYLGSEYGMAYNLADAGYDVWMGNARGNIYSRRHVSLDPEKDKFKFFDFDYEDMGFYDLAAMIDYALATTKQKKLHFISHALGGTQFLVLNSLKSSYRSKFASAHLLAGVGYEKNFPNKIVKLFSSIIDVIYKLSLLTGFVELKASSPITTILAEVLVNSTVPQELLAGGSVKETAHLCQNFRDEKFQSWNFGSVLNLFNYANYLPPSYDLSSITVDVTFHYSLGDITQSETDVLAMVEAMPNARARKVAKDDFNHVDYLANKDVKVLITDYIIKALKNY